MEIMKIQDLGSGSGRNCRALRTLVGPNGQMTGIDMTDEQVCPKWVLNRKISVYLYTNKDISTSPMLGYKMNFACK